MRPVTETRARLGEGPLWHGGRLYWLDITGRALYTYDPSTGEERSIRLPHMLGAVAPRERGGLVAALSSGFAFLDELTGEVTPIADPEAGEPRTRFNDGKCDPAGRFWAGTMGMNLEPDLGALYVLHADGSVEKKLAGVSISNGIAWSPDRGTMYYIDSPTHEVAAFDYDPGTARIANRRTAVAIDPNEGLPDGMAVDENGNLWIALFGGGAVVCHDPRTGGRLAKLDVPAANTTACAFGGPDLDDLYITTARDSLSAAQAAKEPLAGCLFVARPGVRGLPAYCYRG